MSIPFHHDATQVPYNTVDQGPITDCADIITQFRTQVVTGLSWTEPSTGLFKTPVDAAGRFMDVLLTKISAQKLEIRLRDQLAFTIFTRRIQIDNTNGSYVRYFCNKFGCVVESLLSTSEIFSAHVIDLTPDLQSDHAQYVVGTAYRSAADTNDSNGHTPSRLFAKDNGAATVRSRARRWEADLLNSVNITMVDATGAFPTRDLLVTVDFAGTVRWAGRVCHAIICSAANFANGAIVRPNIDDATQVQFKVVGHPTPGSNDIKLAMRYSG